MAGPEVGKDYNGVLLLGEALGQAEAEAGAPFKGPAGFTLQQLIDRVGWKREEFAIENSIRCRPPLNELAGTAYEIPALERCRSHYLQTLEELKPKVIVALGGTATMQALGLGYRPTLEDYLGYIEEGPEGIPVICTWHPSFIMRGAWNLSGIWRWHVRHARMIADGKLSGKPTWPKTIVDPPLGEFEEWVSQYERAVRLIPDLVLAYDIETEHSTKGPEDEFDLSHSSYNILRCSFAHRPGEGVSVPFTTEYRPLIQRLLASAGIKAAWNANYDDPRLERNGIRIDGQRRDLMWAWHDAESDVPKGLGFVVPLLLPQRPRWKHLSGGEPGFYSAVDGANTLDLYRPIHDLLRVDGSIRHYERHAVDLSTTLRRMSRAGVPVCPDRRRAVSADLSGRLGALQADMERCVPPALARYHPERGYVRDPEDTTGLTRITVDAVVKCCLTCGETIVSKVEHTARKYYPGTKDKNPCWRSPTEQKEMPVERWARKLPFTPSNQQLQRYANYLNHKLIVKGGSITFDDEALGRQIKRYPGDPLYPLVRDFRELDKIVGTNIGVFNEETGLWEGGMPVGSDNKVHTTYNYNPSTWRLGSQGPNLQNIPARGDLAKLVRSLFIPEPGCYIVEVDYSAIEAVLVGYFANDPTYVRMAKLGIHDFFNAHVLYRDGKIGELVSTSWSDADLKAFFADLKRRFKPEREVAKRVVHGGNYGMTPQMMMMQYPVEFPSIAAAKLAQGAYFEVFPSIPRWQNQTIELASRQGYLRSPFGNVHKFWKCYNWSRTWDNQKNDWTWEREWADDAKRALAFLPQSTGAGIIKEAMLALPEEILQHLRLQIHDSLLCHFPIPEWESLTAKLKETMMRPIPEMPLPPEWEMGPYLSIGVEAKLGRESWAVMEEGV
jgi:uracil-DNA glycosylase family 4